MASQEAKFGQFKSNLADHIGRKDVKNLSMLCEIKPNKSEQIQEAKNPALEFLNELEKKKVIGADIGIDGLCKSFNICQLYKLESDTRKLFKESMESKEVDVSDSPGKTSVDLTKVRAILRDELTRYKCYEIGMYLGLPAAKLGEIKKNGGDELFEVLHDRHIIQETSIRQLTIALIARGQKRVATLISDLRPGDAGDKPAPQKACKCGKNAFRELKSIDNETLGLACDDKECCGEWLIESVSSSSGDIDWLLHADKKYVYNPPKEVIKSSLKHDVITNLDQIKPGDHIVLRKLFGLYDHHAIFVAKEGVNKMDLIHWQSNSIARMWWNGIASVCRETITFPPWRPTIVRRVNYGREMGSPKLVIARALHMLEDEEQKYSVINNNCETLATYCKTGKGISIQADVVSDILPPFIKRLEKKDKSTGSSQTSGS